MIEITVVRDGSLGSVSIVPDRNVMNIYFLFGAECKDDNQARMQKYLDDAFEIYMKAHNIKSKSDIVLGGEIPIYTLRTLMLWGLGGHYSGQISFPETGCIPGVQSFLMCIFVAIHNEDPSRVLKIGTISEYMVRMSQLMVAKGILVPGEDIKVFDSPINGTPYDISFQLPDEFTIL
jgi:hypothetical protein